MVNWLLRIEEYLADSFCGRLNCMMLPNPYFHECVGGRGMMQSTSLVDSDLLKMNKSSELSHLQYTLVSHEYLPRRGLLLRQPLGLRAVGFRLPHHDSFTSANCNTSSIHHIFPLGLDY